MILSILILLGGLLPFIEEASTYPVTLAEYADYPGGRFIAAEDSTGNVTSYYLKPNWGAEEEVMYSWSGIEKINAEGVSLGNSFVIDAFPTEDKLLTVESVNLQINCVLYGKKLNRQEVISLPPMTESAERPDVHILGKLTDDIVAIRINNFLLYIEQINDNPKFKVIDDNSKTAEIITGVDGIKRVVSLSRDRNTGRLTSYDSFGMYMNSTSYRPGNSSSIIETEDYFAVASESSTSGYVFLQLFEKKSGNLFSVKRLPTGPKLIAGMPDNMLIYHEKHNESGYFSVNEITASGLKNTVREPIPEYLVSPLAVSAETDKCIALFKQGAVMLDDSYAIESAIRFSFEPNFSEDIFFDELDDFWIISSRYYSLLLSKSENANWFIGKFFYEIRNYILPALLLMIIFASFRLNGRIKRLVGIILNLESAGVIFMVDSKGNLVRANEEGKQLTGITSLTFRKKHMSYYLKNQATMQIYRFLVRTIESKTNLKEKMTLNIGNDEKEWLCTSSVLRSVTGAYRGVVFSGIDITEQLEKKRLTNWAQLAHDMQTNLSTIRLNAENIEIENEGIIRSRNAIMHQTNLLIRRVRDIVTVGRHEEVELEKQSSEDICHDAVMEFDEVMFPDIDFIVNADDFRIYCDKPRMVRAVRNAIENGIKAMPEKKGTITVTARRDKNVGVFSIRDTGKGMDEKTKEKMLRPYFTTAKNKGGHGIGTMIIQKVVEMHGGNMSVNSEPGKGTEIILRIPNVKRKIQN